MAAKDVYFSSDARDRMLVTAQDQLDSLAASLADAFSGTTVASTAATSGAQEGYDLDLSSLVAGNTTTFVYKDNTTGKTCLLCQTT